MNLFVRLRMVRFILAVGVVLRALAWGAAAALSVVAAAAAVDQASGLSMHARTVVMGIAIAAAVATMLTLGWRDRRVTSLERVALWLEEHDRTLEYALVTAVESGDERIVPVASTASWSSTARRRATGAVSIPIAVAIGVVIVLLALPRGAVARIRAPHPGDVLDVGAPGSKAGASRLTPLVARIEPPAYTGERVTTLDEPRVVRALVGSILTLRGRGAAAGVTALAGKDTLRATSDSGRWSIALHVGPKPLALRLIDRDFRRIVGVEPIADTPPVVTLISPMHDSVVRTPTGRIPLAASANDDFGIVSASFEYIISSGDGENFTFKSGTLGAVQPHAKRVALSASLVLDAMGLKPGDIIHVRAVAHDANGVSGSGIGTSETRAIRIARADEYDSVAVDPAPPSDADQSIVSERMLITLAEAIETKRPPLKHDMVVSESQSIAIDQKKLRRDVGDIVFTRLGAEASGEEHSDDDTPARAKSMEQLLARADSATNVSADPIDFGEGESPVVAVNKPLLEAYNAMWDASTALDIGEPDKALPHMRLALAAIQRARAAERLYLHGRPPEVLIDISKVRLQGKDKGASSTRHPLTASDSTQRARNDRFMRVVELAGRDPHAAADSLLVMRLDVLTDDPPFAAALGAAAAAIRAGKSATATAALVRARRTVAGAPEARNSLGRWGGEITP